MWIHSAVTRWLSIMKGASLQLAIFSFVHLVDLLFDLTFFELTFQDYFQYHLSGVSNKNLILNRRNLILKMLLNPRLFSLRQQFWRIHWSTDQHLHHSHQSPQIYL